MTMMVRMMLALAALIGLPALWFLLRVTPPALPYRRLANLYRGASHPCAYCYSTGVHQPRGHGGIGDFEGRPV